MHLVTFSALADFPGLLEAHLSAFPKTVSDASGRDADCAPGLESFARQLLAFETDVFRTALSQVLESDRPRITLVDKPLTEFAAADPSASSEPLDPSTEPFQAARKRTLSILEGLSNEQWQRVGRTEDGDLTVIGLVHRLCAHDWTQLAALQSRMAACSAP